ncbi:MAG: glycosyltransferase [Thiohalomonadaceae bacterium]
MDRASLRVLHVVCAGRWASEEATPAPLLRALRTQRGLDNRIALVADGTPVAAPDDDVIVIDHRGHTLARHLRSIRTLAALHPDVVHVHGRRERVLGTWVALRTRSTPVYSVHEREHGVTGAWLRVLCGRMQRNVVCHSPTQGRRLAARAGLCVSVIEPGADVRALDAQAALPVDLALAGDGFHVAFVGPLTAEARLDMALATAWRLARDLSGRFHLHVFGHGETRAACEAFVHRHGLCARVAFHGHREPLAPWLARMNALLWCADEAVTPARVLEAMVLGVPVVARACGDVARLLGFGTRGTLVYEHAPHAYAAALGSLPAHPELARGRAAAAREHARRHCDLGRVAQRYTMLYHSLNAARHGQSLGVCYL